MPSVPVPLFVPSLGFASPLDLSSGGVPFSSLFGVSRRCTRCGADKAPELFARDKRTRQALSSCCRDCDNARQRGCVTKPETAWRRAYWARCRTYGIPPVVEPFTRAHLIARDGNECAECGDAGARLELDHIIPVAAGGPHTFTNCRLVCVACNRRKAGDTDAALIAAYRMTMDDAESSGTESARAR